MKTRKIKQLRFLTSNMDKVREFKELLQVPIINVVLDIPERQMVDLEELIESKIKEAYNVVRAPLFVEHSGLFIDGWNGLPGGLTAAFMNKVGNEGICKMMGLFEYRGASAKTIVGFCDEEIVRTFVGEIRGEIAQAPAGEFGFGWDPIFLPEGYLKTFAQMTPEEKNSISMRRIATDQFRDFLFKNYVIESR